MEPCSVYCLFLTMGLSDNHDDDFYDDDGSWRDARTQRWLIVAVADPDTNNCDGECGGITAANVASHVPCRLQCVLPDFAGLSMLL